MTYKKSRQRKKSSIEIKRRKYKSGNTYSFAQTQSTVDPIPENGKTYHFFDDGKIGLSRHYLATVEKVIPMKYIRRNIKNLYLAWRYYAIFDYWLYAIKSDYAVRCSIREFDKNPIWFFRTKDGGWFSIDYPNCWMSGRLDLNGTYFESCLEAHKENQEALKILNASEEKRKEMNNG